MSAPHDEIRKAALALIARQPYTTHRLRHKLRRRGFARETVDEVLEALMDAGVLDDAAYAAEYATYHGRARGPRRIAADLRARGVASTHIRAALAQIETGDEGEIALEVMRKMRSRYAGLEPRVAGRRAYAMLARRGFSADAARYAMERTLGGDPDEDG